MRFSDYRFTFDNYDIFSQDIKLPCRGRLKKQIEDLTRFKISDSGYITVNDFRRIIKSMDNTTKNLLLEDDCDFHIWTIEVGRKQSSFCPAGGYRFGNNKYKAPPLEEEKTCSGTIYL